MFSTEPGISIDSWYKIYPDFCGTPGVFTVEHGPTAVIQTMIDYSIGTGFEARLVPGIRSYAFVFITVFGDEMPHEDLATTRKFTYFFFKSGNFDVIRCFC